jgi:N-acetyl-gamma-glutamylphosphate reductase
MIAETRTTKALRNVVFALTLTLTGARSMTHSSVAQAQTSSPTTTGVMVILTVKAGVAREQVMAVMPAEIRYFDSSGDLRIDQRIAFVRIRW